MKFLILSRLSTLYSTQRLVQEIRLLGHEAVVVKDCLSSQGEGVFLCGTPNELVHCLMKLQGREVLFQEFIAESQGRDIRAFIIGQNVIASMGRSSANPLLEFRSHRVGLILEVNPCPGLEGIENCSQKNIAKEVVFYAESRYRTHS